MNSCSKSRPICHFTHSMLLSLMLRTALILYLICSAVNQPCKGQYLICICSICCTAICYFYKQITFLAFHVIFTALASCFCNSAYYSLISLGIDIPIHIAAVIHFRASSRKVVFSVILQLILFLLRGNKKFSGSITLCFMAYGMFMLSIARMQSHCDNRVLRYKQSINSLQSYWAATMNLSISPIFIITEKNRLLFQNNATSQLYNGKDFFSFFTDITTNLYHSSDATFTVYKNQTYQWNQTPIVYEKNNATLITCAQQLPNLSQNYSQLEMFVASSAHDLRTPLNGIKNNVAMAKDFCDEQGNDYLNKCTSACELQEALISDILDSVKLSNQKLVINIHKFSVEKLLRDCSDIFELQAKFKSLEFEWSCSSMLPIECYSDERRIKQIILNLLSNSLKFTLKGKISILAKYKDKNIKISVRDTGIGITPENIKMLFIPFSVLKCSRSLNRVGTGLGLSLCAQLCRCLGGDIKVTSKIGQGSKFSFFVKDKRPLSNKFLQSIHGADLPFLSTNETRRKSKSFNLNEKSKELVLVVDDMPINLSVAKSMIQKLGVGVVVTSSGKEAIELAKNNKMIRLALIDLSMPVMDGYDVAMELQNLMKCGKVIRFSLIALTGDSKSDVMEKASESGFSDVITKPLEIDVLKELVEKFE